MQRTFLLIYLIASLIPSYVSGKDYTPETVPNTHLSDRYNYVSNPDGIISANDVEHINRLLRMVEDSMEIEVAVVAIESIGENDAQEFATDLLNKWGLGKKDKDNGLLIQLVTEPSQRSVVFETGYGLEGILPDVICYRLQQRYMIPDMKSGDYSQGMVKGVEAVKEYLFANNEGRQEMIPTGNHKSNTGDDNLLFAFCAAIIGFLFIVFLSVYYTRYRPRRCPRCGQKTLVYTGQRIIQRATYSASGISQETYRCKNCGHTDTKNRSISKLRDIAGPVIIGGSGRPRWGGGFGGGFSGGGGSWGGGRSGGGGSISRF